MIDTGAITSVLPISPVNRNVLDPSAVSLSSASGKKKSNVKNKQILRLKFFVQNDLFN